MVQANAGGQATSEGRTSEAGAARNDADRGRCACYVVCGLVGSFHIL